MKWSVMIPVYNNIEYLQETLESVLNQENVDFTDFQIEVIDNCSTDGDVKKLVKEIGKGKVKYFKQTRNVGLVNNWNTCINKAQGEIIHILHGDDYIFKNFYSRSEAVFNQLNADALFTSNYYILQDGMFEHKLLQKNTGILENEELIFVEGNIQCASVCVKKSVYDKVGLFDSNFTECVDWQMWKKIAVHFKWHYIPEYLCVYRIHNESFWNSRTRSGVNFSTMLKSIEYFKNYNENYFIKAKQTQKSNIRNNIYSLSKLRDWKNLGKNVRIYYQYSNNIKETFFLLAKSLILFLPKKGL